MSWMIYGANGYTGVLAAREAVRANLIGLEQAEVQSRSTLLGLLGQPAPIDIEVEPPVVEADMGELPDPGEVVPACFERRLDLGDQHHRGHLAAVAARLGALRNDDLRPGINRLAGIFEGLHLADQRHARRERAHRGDRGSRAGTGPLALAASAIAIRPTNCSSS